MTGSHSEPQRSTGEAYRRLRAVSRRGFVALVSVAVAVAAAAVTVGLVRAIVPSHARRAGPNARAHGRVVITLPTRPMSYIGVYVKGLPTSGAPLNRFAAQTKVRPNLALYYSGWREPFKTSFARQAAREGAVPLIQMEPGGARLRNIADGEYDSYLVAFARAVAEFGRETGRAVVIGFAHEPNGPWYPWGNGHVSPRVWVAAWRHVVDVFRGQGADNVTWLWTINIIDVRQHIAAPAPWWPGRRYVTWVGIDGYYYKRTWNFAPLFGPAIKAAHELTRDPILISETGAAPAAGKAAKIADLFAGIRSYGLLGLVWFNVNRVRDWRINTPSAIAAFQAGASKFGRLGP